MSSLIARRGAIAESALNPPSYSGSGTVGDPYVLLTAEDMEALHDEPSAYHVLGADVTLTSWTPASFSGDLDGQGYTITLTGVSVQGATHSGFFTTSTGDIRRLGIIGGDFSSANGGSSYKAVFAGTNSGAIEDCFARGGTVTTGGDRAGGLVGYQGGAGSLTECYAAVNRSGVVGSRVGGITGWNDGTNTRCYFDFQTWGSNALGGGTTTGVTYKTTTEMKTEVEFVNWDFTLVWTTNQDTTYPEHLPVGSFGVVEYSESSDLSGPTATSVTVPVPTGTVDGDFLVAAIMHREGAGTLTPPSGWSLLREDKSPTFDQWQAVYTRTASSEPASYNWTGPTTTRKAGGMVATRNEFATPTVITSDLSTFNASDSPADHTGSSVSSEGDRLLLSLSSCAYAGTTSWSWTGEDEVLWYAVGARIAGAATLVAGATATPPTVSHAGSSHDAVTLVVLIG